MAGGKINKIFNIDAYLIAWIIWIVLFECFCAVQMHIISVYLFRLLFNNSL